MEDAAEEKEFGKVSGPWRGDFRWCKSWQGGSTSMVVKGLRRLVLMVGALVFLAGPCLAEDFMTKEKLKDMLGKPGVYIIDIRTPMEWLVAKSKIPGAVHETRGEYSTWGKKYPKDGTIVVY
jgi:hypothetical protein